MLMGIYFGWVEALEETQSLIDYRALIHLKKNHDTMRPNNINSHDPSNFLLINIANIAPTTIDIAPIRTMPSYGGVSVE